MNSTILNERSQIKKATENQKLFHFYDMPRTGKSMETESRLVVARGPEGHRGGEVGNDC